MISKMTALDTFHSCCPHVILDFGDPSTLLKSFIAILVAHDAYTMSTLTAQARHVCHPPFIAFWGWNTAQAAQRNVLCGPAGCLDTCMMWTDATLLSTYLSTVNVLDVQYGQFIQLNIHGGSHPSLVHSPAFLLASNVCRSLQRWNGH
ncbi:hypothetical protein PSTT_07770, partial [Puccinia striiformis]